MILRNWFYIISLLSLAAISSALIAEHVFNLEPCSMCLKQRQPYYFIIIIFIFFKFFNKLNHLWFYLSAQIASIYGLFYSVWHVGIEQKILKGPSDCASDINFSNSTENLKEQIMEKTVVNCEDIIWSIFGLSAATINTMLIMLIFVINTIYLIKYNDSKKNTAL